MAVSLKFEEDSIHLTLEANGVTNVLRWRCECDPACEASIFYGWGDARGTKLPQDTLVLWAVPGRVIYANMSRREMEEHVNQHGINVPSVGMTTAGSVTGVATRVLGGPPHKIGDLARTFREMFQKLAQA